MDENWTYPHDLGNLHIYLVGGIPTPLKNMKVSWDDDIPNMWKIKFMFQTTNQMNVRAIDSRVVVSIKTTDT